MKKKVLLYTDGACAFNPGPGGWGAVLIYGAIEKEISGFENDTTNNRMELLAVIKGLEQLKESCEVSIYTDSAYIFNAFTNDWISGWQSNGWKNSNKKTVLNMDLWQQLITLTQKHVVNWNKVLGHSTNHYNNICDRLARGQVDKYLKEQKNQ